MSHAAARSHALTGFRIKRLLTRPLVWVSAVTSGILISYIGVIPYFYTSGLAAKDPLPAEVDLAIMTGLTFLIGVPFARFLLRALPLRADGKRRKATITIVGLFAAGWIAEFFLLWSGIIEIPTLPGEPPLELSTQGFLAATAWMLGASLPFLSHHIAPRSFLRRPFVLFLRRFHTFSDRVIINAILRSTPAAKPVAFLTAPVSTAKDWNPFSVGFAGFKFWRPIRSLPADLRSGEPWEQNARDLIRKADVIVLDATEGSESIATEIEMIREGGFLDKTLVVVPQEPKTPGAPPADLVGESASVVRYRKSWRRAIPGLLLGAAGSFVAAYPLTLIALVLILPVDPRLWTSQNLWTVLALLFGTTGWLFYVLFLRPALDRDSARELKKRLRTQLQHDGSE